MIQLIMAEFHLAAWLSGCWYHTCRLAVTPGHLNRTKPLLTQLKTPLFFLQDEISAVKKKAKIFFHKVQEILKYKREEKAGKKFEQ